MTEPGAAPDRSSALLEVRSLTRRFGGVIAVDRCDLTVEKGEIHALIGPNGSGKTTTLNMISGVIAPTSGVIRLAGADISRLGPTRIARKGIARTFQNIRLFDGMTARGNILAACRGYDRLSFASVLVPRRAARLAEAEAAEEVDALLEMVALAKRADAQAGLLSYGDKRRLEIARALATKPSLLLLDEPAAGMNATETHDLTRLLRTIRASGTTILLIEHDMSLVMGISDSVTVLNFGTHIARGSPAEIRADPSVINAYLGNAADAA